MNVSDFLRRARSQIGKGAYRMGGGKIAPVGNDCLDEGGACDCSAFVCWSARIRKFQEHEYSWLSTFNGGWWNTDGIWCSVDLPSNFVLVSQPNDPKTPFTIRPGAVVVYPRKETASVAGPKIGHVGIITAVRSALDYTVVHCSQWNMIRLGHAIAETDGKLFEAVKSRRFFWPSSVTP